MLKNVTLSAEEDLIRQAREKARKERTTLNATFRRWLRQYVNRTPKNAEFKAFMDSLAYARPGRTFSRDELNER